MRLRSLLPLVALLVPGCADGGGSRTGEAESVVPWRAASEHIGEKVTVEGKVVSAHFARRKTGGPTFLNLGHDYPDPNRFVVVIWADDREKFPQPPGALYRGKAIRVTGRIQTYDGVPQIEVSSPESIEVVSPPALWTRPNL